MLPKNIIITDAFMPSFLQAIFRNVDTVNLIYCEKNSYAPQLEESFETSAVIRKEPVEDADAFVGNPLQVDLKVDESVEIINAAEISPSWLKEECAYFPIEYQTAQELLNESSIKSASLRMIICNGKDSRKTLTIGVETRSFSRYLVYYRGKHQLTDEKVSFPNMLKTHERNAGRTENVHVSVANLFALVGLHKRLARDLQNLENVGNAAFVECTGRAQTFHITQERKTKLFLQVNAQNRDSIFHSLWKDLCQIEYLLEMLRDNDNLDELEIGEEVWPYYKVDEVIQDALNMYSTRNIQKRVPIDWANVNLDEMRPKEFLEQLWNALNHLDRIEPIRQCFHSLFQEFANESTIKYNVPSSNYTMIGHIIKSLIEGMTAVPTLSLQLTLTYLIELGLNKIHNDYKHLIKEMDEKLLPLLDAQWSTIVNDATSKQITKKPGARKSRLTVVHGQENYSGLLLQLNYIAQLHLIVEFMHMVRSFKVDNKSPIYDTIAKSTVVKKYTFKTLKLSPVVDFECALSSNDISVLENMNKVAINVQFHSDLPENPVTTIFHFSVAPIYPDTIFNNYGENVKGDESTVYFLHEGLVLQG